MSIDAFIFQTALKIFGIKKWVHRGFIFPARGTATMLAARFHPDLELFDWQVEGFSLLTIQHLHPSEGHLVFFHGGGYINEASSLHRIFFQKLLLQTGFDGTFIDYPKAPEHDFRVTHQVVLKAYQALRKRFPGQEFCLLGDSAGGGLALALLQVLRDQKVKPVPQKTVLISPWVDLTMSHPDIRKYQSRDPLLSLEGLRYAAKTYAGGEDLKNPLLSPLYGDLSNLGTILLITGTEEILYPDCLELKNRLRDASGSKVEFLVGQRLMHDWPIFPYPEARKALEVMVDFLSNGIRNQPIQS